MYGIEPKVFIGVVAGIGGFFEEVYIELAIGVLAQAGDSKSQQGEEEYTFHDCWFVIGSARCYFFITGCVKLMLKGFAFFGILPLAPDAFFLLEPNQQSGKPNYSYQ